MKGFKDSNNKFHPITQSKGVRKSRDQTAKTEGVKINRKKRLIKRFDFVVNVEVYATSKNEAEEIIDKIQNENEFPDGSIIDSDVQFGRIVKEKRK